MKWIGVFLVLVAVAAAQNDTQAEAAPAPPPLPPAPPTSIVCQLTVHGHTNMTLSHVPIPADECKILGYTVSNVGQVQAYKVASSLAALLRRFQTPNASHTTQCNITVYTNRLDFPHVSSDAECNAVLQQIELSARVAVYDYLESVRMARGLPKDGDVHDLDGRQQSAGLTPHPPCMVGPYGLVLAHWIESDCAAAKWQYNKCLAKLEGGGSKESMMQCFTVALTAVESA